MGIKKIGNIVLVQLSDIDSNIYVIGNTIIDTGTGFNFTRLKDVFRFMKKSMEDVKQIISTHHHFDHTGGIGYFLNGKIVIHEQDAEVLEKADVEASMCDFFGGQMHPKQVAKKLKEGDKLKADNVELEVIHTPGHTPGSICLYDRKNKILFSGDTIFADGFGRTDLIGGDSEALKQSIEKLLKLDIQKILPGHGDIVDKEAKKRIDYLLKNVKIETDEESEAPM